MPSKFRRARVKKHFEEQDGLCWWCKKPMRIIAKSINGTTGNGLPKDAATLEHIYDKFDGLDKHHRGPTVAACNKCNGERATNRHKQILAADPYHYKARSGHYGVSERLKALRQRPKL